MRFARRAVLLGRAVKIGRGVTAGVLAGSLVAGSLVLTALPASANAGPNATATATAGPRVAPAAATTTALNLLDINDFHGRIDANTVKWAGTIATLRQAAGPQNTLLLSGGDNISASLFASASLMDQPTIDVLNAMGLNTSTVGNHEFDKGFADLIQRVIAAGSNARWDYLGANVYQKGTTTPALPEFATYTVDGVTIGVIGAVTAETSSLVSPGGITTIDIGDPVAAVNRVADKLTDGDPSNGEAQVLIAEYHEGATLGTAGGGTLANQLALNGPFARIVNQTSPKVSVLFTGHTHQAYAWDAPVPGRPGVTRPVLQTGSYGDHVGHVVLNYDKTANQVTSYTQENVPRSLVADTVLTAQFPDVAKVKTIVDGAIASSGVIGNQVIGNVKADITTAYVGANRDDRASESTLGNTVANALRDGLSSADRGGAQIGVVNPGGLRAELPYAPDGRITYAEANAVLPFVNNLWTLSLTGAQFKAVLEQMWQPATSSRPFLNLGLSDNVAYTLDPAAAVGSHITSVTIDGAPLDPSASYRIGTFSFLGTGGDNFTEFTKATDVKDTGLIDRDVWIDYLKAHDPIGPSFARRGVIVTSLPSAVTAGLPVSFGVSRLDLTSLGSPVNTSVTASIGGIVVGTFPVTAGAATVAFTVPPALVGAQTLTLLASPSTTTVTIALTVAKKPTAKGTVTVAPAKVRAGGSVTVTLGAWDPRSRLTITLDGTRTLARVTTDSKGAGKVEVDIARSTKVGPHQVVATTGDGVRNSAELTVTRYCVPFPGPHAGVLEFLRWFIAWLGGYSC